MKTRNMVMLRSAAALALVLAIAACPGPEERPDDHMDDMDMNGMQMDGMDMDHGAMQRHAEELDEATDRMRAHLVSMREAGEDEWSDRMGEHVRETSGFLSLLRRQMREMDMGMGMDDEAMGEMMGMTATEHRRMMEDMETLRSELETLQVARDAEVRELMPVHMDRLERLVAMSEESAGHMRRM